jgi:hypothetical protein
MDKPTPRPFDWARVFPPLTDLDRFRLALLAGRTVADARKIAASRAPMHYDAARVWGNGSER